EPELDLVQPTAVLRCIEEAEAMAGITQERCAGRHGLQDSSFLLLPQILLDATCMGDQSHQGLGLMRVELIHDKEPWGLRISRNSLGDMRCKVFLGSAWSYGGRHHFPRRHVEVGDQTLRPMAEVFILGTLDEAGLPRQRWGGSLQRLYPGLLIGTDDMLPLLGDHWRVLVHRADCGHLGG